jgi:hypothetical protein
VQIPDHAVSLASRSRPSGPVLSVRLHLDLDQVVGVGQGADFDHGGHRPDLAEELGMGPADRFLLADSDDVHPGPHHIVGGYAGLSQRAQRDAEGRDRLRVRVTAVQHAVRAGRGRPAVMAQRPARTTRQ